MFPEAHSAVLLRDNIRLWILVNNKTFQCSSLGERGEERRVIKRSKTEDGIKGRREVGSKKRTEKMGGGKAERETSILCTRVSDSVWNSEECTF